MNRKILIAALAGMLTLCGTVAALADEIVYLGAFVPSAKLSGNAQFSFDGITLPYSLKMGTGLGGKLGVELGRYFAVEGAIFRSSHSAGSLPSIEFTGDTIDLKVLFPMKETTIKPFLLGGLGFYQLKSSINTFRGDGYQYGLGASMPIATGFSVGIGYTLRNITLDHGTTIIFQGQPLKTRYEEKARTFDISLVYHFL